MQEGDRKVAGGCRREGGKEGCELTSGGCSGMHVRRMWKGENVQVTMGLTSPWCFVPVLQECSPLQYFNLRRAILGVAVDDECHDQIEHHLQ